MIDTLCGDCNELEYKYYYSSPHPARRFWYCKTLGEELVKKLGILGGIRKDVKCPKLQEVSNEIRTDRYKD